MLALPESEHETGEGEQHRADDQVERLGESRFSREPERDPG